MAKFNVTFDLDDSIVPLAIDTLAKKYGYTDKISEGTEVTVPTVIHDGVVMIPEHTELVKTEIDNPQTKTEFVMAKEWEVLKWMLVNNIRQVKLSEARAASDAMVNEEIIKTWDLITISIVEEK